MSRIWSRSEIDLDTPAPLFIDFACSQCRADVGEPCLRGGRPLVDKFHAPRMDKRLKADLLRLVVQANIRNGWQR